MKSRAENLKIQRCRKLFSLTWSGYNSFSQLQFTRVQYGLFFQRSLKLFNDNDLIIKILLESVLSFFLFPILLVSIWLTVTHGKLVINDRLISKREFCIKFVERFTADMRAPRRMHAYVALHCAPRPIFLIKKSTLNQLNWLINDRFSRFALSSLSSN